MNKDSHLTNTQVKPYLFTKHTTTRLLSIDECGPKCQCHTQKHKYFKSMDSHLTFMCNFTFLKLFCSKL